MRLTWSRQALRDLREIRDYIAEHDRSAALRVAERLEAIVRMLPTYPQIGRPGRKAGTRELVATGTPYIVVYSVGEGHVVILAVRHGARDRTYLH